jgi:DNA polymerase III alpha subunit
MKTILKDRILWFDGEITFTPDQLMDYILNGGEITNGIHVSALTEDIKSYNKLYPNLTVNVKRDLEHLDHTWKIPEAFKSINITKFVGEKMMQEITRRENLGKSLTDDEVNARVDRIETELALFKQNDMSIILKAIIYIIDVFKRNGVVWGTGRGSSCCSYILYLIGLHSVDSVKYELDLKEFFK